MSRQERVKHNWDGILAKALDEDKVAMRTSSDRYFGRVMIETGFGTVIVHDDAGVSFDGDHTRTYPSPETSQRFKAWVVMHEMGIE